jgi:predicted nuclease with TOPRIM domain
MDTQAILITVVSVLGSGAAFQFYEKRMRLKREINKEDKSEQTLWRDDLRNEVDRLRSMVDEHRDIIMSLTAENSTLKERVTHLEKENERLKNLR